MLFLFVDIIELVLQVLKNNCTMNDCSLNKLFQDSIRNNWDRPALTDFNGATFQYKDVARKIAKIHLLYEHIGMKPGDKVALCGRNSSQ